MTDRTLQQIPPTPNNNQAIADLVIEDIKSKKAFGLKKYKTPLQSDNRRDMLIDAYQEGLDLVQYLLGEIIERGGDYPDW